MVQALSCLPAGVVGAPLSGGGCLATGYQAAAIPTSILTCPRMSIWPRPAHHPIRRCHKCPQPHQRLFCAEHHFWGQGCSSLV